MTNELINYEQLNVQQDQILELSIRQRKIDTKNGKQKVIDVMMNLPTFKDIEDESGLVVKTYQGDLNRWISLHFRKDAFNNLPSECKLKGIEDLSTGKLYVKATSVFAPNEYYVEKEEKNEDAWTTRERLDFEEKGVTPVIKKYPECWIHANGIVGFLPYRPSQDRFTYKKKNQNSDPEESELVENNE